MLLAIADPNTIEALSVFLKYGPIGLAGLMLTLVIIALAIGELKPAKERLLRQFMNVGAACFALAIFAPIFISAPGSHLMHFRVVPIDKLTESNLPPPIIYVNNKPLDDKMNYVVESESTAIVDVEKALKTVASLKNQVSSQNLALQKFFVGAPSLASDLNRIPAIIDKNCSGGANGVSAQSNGAVIAITSKVAAKIEEIEQQATAAIQYSNK